MQVDLYVAPHYSGANNNISYWNVMSIIISTVQAALAPVLDVSILGAIQTLLGMTFSVALLVLFKPLLRGIARALVLLVKPRLSKEQRLAQRQMKDTMIVKRMLQAMDGSASSQAADLRALGR
jgi:hypothetical protein